MYVGGAGGALAAGFVIFGQGSSCPDGYERWTTADGKFLRMNAAQDHVGGGSTTHGHTADSHDHSTPNHGHGSMSHSHGNTSGDTSQGRQVEFTVSSGAPRPQKPAHTHSLTSGGSTPSTGDSGAGTSGAGGGSVTDATGVRPPTTDVVFCRKQAA